MIASGPRRNKFRGIPYRHAREFASADSALAGQDTVTIKFFLKTVPLKHWDVRRELLRRIKRRFDKLQVRVSAAEPAYLL